MVKPVLLLGIGSAAVLWLAQSAGANPFTPVPVIEQQAVVFCNEVNANPTAEGVVRGLERAQLSGFDEIDGAYVLITAVHHTCAQHERLVMDVVGEFAMPDGCKEMA